MRANSSVICWKVLFSTAPLLQARSSGSMGRACSTRAFKVSRSSQPHCRSAPPVSSSAIACWQRAARGFEIGGGLGGECQALPDVGARQQPRVLGLPGVFDGIAGEPGSELGVVRRVLADLFFEAGVLDRALQQAGARQEDGVAPLLSLAEGRGGIGDGAFQIAAIEVEQSRIDVHGADSAVLSVAGIDLERRGELGAGIGAQALDFRSPGAGGLAGCLVGIGAPAGGGSIDVLLLAQGDQALHYRNINQGAREVQVLGIAALIFGDGAVEVFEGRFVASLAAGDAAVGGLYVAAGDEIVGSAERGLGFLQQAHGFVEFALLEASQLSSTCTMAAMGA